MHLDIKDTPEFTQMLLADSKYDVEDFRTMLIEVDLFKVRRKKSGMVLKVFESISERAEHLFILLSTGSVQVVIGETPIYDVDPDTIYAYNKRKSFSDVDEVKSVNCICIDLVDV
jgi:hypothetical protein